LWGANRSVAIAWAVSSVASEGFDLLCSAVARAGGQRLGIEYLEELELEIAAAEYSAHAGAGPPQGGMKSTTRKPRSG
jgi:hypothetical protein